MRRALQLLLASLALVSLMSPTNAGPLNLMSAPNLLRVGTAENIIQTNKTLYTPNSKENCSMQKNSQISNDERTPKICESTEASKVEYAYKVLVEEIVHEQSIDMYAMRVQDSIKDGSIDVGPMGKLRQFLSYPHCREALKLEKGKTYLIMGSSRDIYRDEKQQTYQYVLGEITWIEYWPTAEECQRDEHTDTCLGLEKMVEQYTVFGCPN